MKSDARAGLFVVLDAAFSDVSLTGDFYETTWNMGLFDGGEGDLRNFNLFYFSRFVNGIFLPIVGLYVINNFSHSGDLDYNFFFIIFNIGRFSFVV